MGTQIHHDALDKKSNLEMAVMVDKVAADIAFLEDKLKFMDSQRTPNQTVIKIYKDMLVSRESVLNWLSKNNTKDNGEDSTQIAINH